MRQTDTPGYVSLQQIVNDVKVDLNDFTNRDHKRFIRWAMRGMETFSLQYIYKAKTVKVHVDKDNNTVPIPADSLSVLGVGTIQNGRFYGFTIDREITSKLEDIDEDVRPEYYEEGDVFDEFPYLGSINNTYYKIDINNSRIILSGKTYDYVFVKYKSSGLDAPDNTLIPVFAQEALISFVKYKLVQDDRETPEYVIRRKQRDYLDARRKMIGYQTATIQQIDDTLAKNRTRLPS